MPRWASPIAIRTCELTSRSGITRSVSSSTARNWMYAASVATTPIATITVTMAAKARYRWLATVALIGLPLRAEAGSGHLAPDVALPAQGRPGALYPPQRGQLPVPGVLQDGRDDRDAEVAPARVPVEAVLLDGQRDQADQQGV